MNYQVLIQFYSKRVNLFTEMKVINFQGKEALKDYFDSLCIDVHTFEYVDVVPEGNKIVFSNGDMYLFDILYNGKSCKKYSHGVK